jgi:diguanylate cyclase (GGDEF)-like protein
MAAIVPSPACAAAVPSEGAVGGVLRATCLVQAMVVAEAWLATGAGLADACLLWSIGTDADTASAWRGTGGEPAPTDALLVGRLVEHRAGQASAPLPDGRRRHACLLVTPSEDGFVVVAWSGPDLAASPAMQADPAWPALCAALQVRLRVERLRGAVDRLAKAERLQRALYAIADLASADLEMQDMLRGLHGIVGGLMYAENLFIVRYSPERETLRWLYVADTVDQTEVDQEHDVPVSNLSNSLTLAMMRRGRPFHGPSHEVRRQLGVERDAALGPESEDWLGVPMMRGAEVRGAIVVQSYDAGRSYTEEDRVLLSFVAQHILTALERKQAQEELERRVEERTRDLAQANETLTWEVAERHRGERLQSALFRIAELSTTAGTIEQFYREVHAIVGALLDARNFFIALLTDDGSELDFPYSVDEHDPRRPRRRLDKGLTEHVLRTGRALLADSDAVAALNASGEIRIFGTRAVCWLGVPLPGDDAPLGVLAVQSYTPDQLFGPRDQELLTFVAHHIAQGLQRKRAQDSLRAANAELERRVAERTRELAEANRELRDQIGERERAELRLKHQAQHDALTGLPNRAYLLERLGHALARFARDRRRHFAVLFLDLDRFKVINDSVGHLVGDEMLKEAGTRIAAALRSPDMVARLGGDEFAILLEDIAGEHDAYSVARRVIQSLGEPIRVGGKELFTSASVGIAVSHPRYARAEDLLRDADVAMYRAKAKGRQRFEVFDEQLHTEALKLLDLEGDLRRAIARNEFEPHFQAIVDLRDGRTVGYEALLRWRHGERGLLLPGDFLDVAEDNGSVEQIDWQMFDLTCREIPRVTDEHT